MPEFDVKIVTSDRGPVMALNQVPIIPACAMHDIKDADVIILPSQGFLFNARDKDHSDRIEWLETWYEKGTDLASVCAGAFNSVGMILVPRIKKEALRGKNNHVRILDIVHGASGYDWNLIEGHDRAAIRGDDFHIKFGHGRLSHRHIPQHARLQKHIHG
jgi:hypothetical protein